MLEPGNDKKKSRPTIVFSWDFARLYVGSRVRKAQSQTRLSVSRFIPPTFGLWRIFTSLKNADEAQTAFLNARWPGIVLCCYSQSNEKKTVKVFCIFYITSLNAQNNLLHQGTACMLLPKILLETIYISYKFSSDELTIVF